MMTSVLVSPGGQYEYEAAHGTVTRHYYRHLAGEKTSTNCMATLFAWTGALKKRAQLDGNAPLGAFAKKLEDVSMDLIGSGTLTRDLAAISTVKNKNVVDTQGFIEAIADGLQTRGG
jgi:isocitrate dehydrogenase